MHSFNFVRDRELQILCLGAHCDDIEIGCGATLIDLLASSVKTRVTWVVFSSNEVREREARHAASLIGAEAIGIEVLQYRNGYFPFEGAQIKDHFEQLKARVQPDVIFTHHVGDAHQDHRTIAELTWNTFRNNLVLEYEIPKFDGDLGRPSVFVPVSREIAQRKVEVLRSAFVSQQDRQWFTEATFMGLMRLRGLECNSPSGFAEAFHCRKLCLGL